MSGLPCLSARPNTQRPDASQRLPDASQRCPDTSQRRPDTSQRRPDASQRHNKWAAAASGSSFRPDGETRMLKTGPSRRTPSFCDPAAGPLTGEAPACVLLH